MPYTLKAKRMINASSKPEAASMPPCGLCLPCQPAPTEGSYHQSYSPTKTSDRGYLPTTTSGCTTATAATNASSVYPSNASAMELSSMEQEACPVTGVYADISDDYYISPDVLGKGHYGVVRECTHRATRRSFAVKSIDKSKIGRLDHLQHEIYLLANVDHRGILKMVDCYEDERYVHIVTEKYAGGELFDRIVDSTNSHGCLSEREAGRVVKSLLEAVAYLHDNDVVHRDIKPENVMFESGAADAAVKLVDFGLSRRHAECDGPMTNPVGTAYYMSPELLRGRYGKSTDVWSVGVVAYVLLCGFPPFNGGNDAEVHDATRRNPLRFPGGGWMNKSDEAVDFVGCLLRKDPRRRFTAREALMHPWIRKAMTF